MGASAKEKSGYVVSSRENIRDSDYKEKFCAPVLFRLDCFIDNS